MNNLTRFSYGTDAKKENKLLCVYYSNWAPVDKRGHYQKVRELPWDRLAVINHAFFKILPNESRTEFPIVSTNEELDLGKGGAFDQYREMREKYPDVKVVISVGGWVDTKWFSLMSGTRAGRESFIASCAETLKKYPFIGGIDIDWEYPGVTRNGEGEAYLGSADDRDNFTALMRELRETFDECGMKDKTLTYCTTCSTEALKRGTICLDFAELDKYVDRANLMTYDMSYNSGQHHAALNPGKAVVNGASVKEVTEYVMSLGVPAHKICIGAPLYSRGCKIKAESGEKALGGESFEKIRGMQWYELKTLESQPGWEALYDEEAEAAYLFNNDPESADYQVFHSYDNERSLQAKLDYINEIGLGGLIVWDTPGDSMGEQGDFLMLTQMAKELRKGDKSD